MSKSILNPLRYSFAALALAFFPVACDSPSENAAEDLGDAIEDATDAAGDAAEDAGDAVEDAVDN